MTVVVEGAAGEQVAVDDAGLVDEDAAAHLEVEPALGDAGHPPPADAVGPGRNFDAVADAGDRPVVVEEVLGDADQVGIVADIFRRPAAGEEDAGVVLGIDVLERDLGLDLVALPFAGDRPARADLVQHHLEEARLRPRDDRLEARLLQAEIRIEGVHRLRGVADDDEDLVLRH